MCVCTMTVRLDAVGRSRDAWLALGMIFIQIAYIAATGPLLAFLFTENIASAIAVGNKHRNRWRTNFRSS